MGSTVIEPQPVELPQLNAQISLITPPLYVITSITCDYLCYPVFYAWPTIRMKNGLLTSHRGRIIEQAGFKNCKPTQKIGRQHGIHPTIRMFLFYLKPSIEISKMSIHLNPSLGKGFRVRQDLYIVIFLIT